MADIDREVTIVSPFDSTVGAVIMEESISVWEAQGWRVGTPDAPVAEKPVAAGEPALPAPVVAPVPNRFTP